MRGIRTTWVPGSDHAGIATQTVVEKWLKSTKNLSRHDIGREKFLEEVWSWRRAKGDMIFMQLEKLGASLDWDRTCFTMSKGHTKAVNAAFRRALLQGRIKRVNHMCNWSPAIKSVISDIEVDHVEVDGKRYLQTPSGKALVGQIHDVVYKVHGIAKFHKLFQNKNIQILFQDQSPRA